MLKAILPGSLESTILITNTFTRQIEVAPVIYTASGGLPASKKITMGSMASCVRLCYLSNTGSRDATVLLKAFYTIDGADSSF